VIRLFPGIYLFVNGVLFCVLAWLFLFDAGSWFGSLQITGLSSVAYVELRSVYVGLMGGLGVFYLVAATNEGFQLPAVVLAVLTMLGLVVVRSWGVLIEQSYSTLLLQLLALESVDLLAGVAAAYCLYRLGLKKRNPYF
jgi:hypothetical protein